MPTNLLVWNVQFFSSNKISVAQSNWLDLVDTNGNIVDGNFNTLMNLEYITSNVQLADAHIFVLIENLSDQGTMGSLAEGNGAKGSLLLLDRIRGATINRNWMLVPPLKMVNKVQTETSRAGGYSLVKEGAYTECVSVYYRSDLLNFVGPYVWPQSLNNDSVTKVAQRNTGQTTQAYPDAWNGSYPAGNFYAGQFEYFADPAARTGQYLFPDTGGRRPFFTQFRELTGAARLLSLVSVHFPPKFTPASRAFATTTTYFSPEKYQAQADEVVLIAGDFNLNYLLNPLDKGYISQSDALYGQAARKSFTLALNRRNTQLPTMMKQSDDATPPDGYLRPNLGLDNIALRYGGGALNFQTTVYDRVNRNAPSMMFTPMAEIMQLPTQIYRNTVFRLQQNFKYMGPVPGVSDHLPVYLQF
jgi:hypothetical protein